MYVVFLFANNINTMIYIIGIIAGILNGLFASGAGQIITIYLIFFKNVETHISRNISISTVGIASLISAVLYYKEVDIDILHIILIIVISSFGGFIGNKVMDKINSDILNIIAGIIITILAIYGVIKL